jgi:hypothetical protein
MKKIIRLTESDLARIVKRVLNEQEIEPSGIEPSGIEPSGIEPSPVTTTGTLKDCITFLTKGDTSSIREPMDREMTGEGITIKNVTIEYNPTVTPGYRSVRMSKNGKPFCKTNVD